MRTRPCHHRHVTEPAEARIDEGNGALRAGDWAAAHDIFDRALAEGATGEVLEGLGRACYGLRDYRCATEAFEHAFVRFRDEGNDARAALIAGRWLAWLYGGVYGNAAASGGWLARADSLLNDPAIVVERGWVELIHAAFTDEHAVREQSARKAMMIAEECNDNDLRFCALAYIGECAVVGGQVGEGMAMLDEALAACSSGEVADFVVVGEIYCKLFAACEYTHDVVRAEQWLSVVDDLGRKRNLIGFTSICRTHYGAILTAAGRWSEADEELTTAARGFDESYQALAGNALVKLADLRLRQGRLEEADRLLAGLDWHPGAQLPMAGMHLARGDGVLARDVLERALAQPAIEEGIAAPLLAALVDVSLSHSTIEDASTASERLTALAERSGAAYPRALAALARGQVGAALGAHDVRACFEEALLAFGHAQMPLELARTQLELARAVRTDHPEVAVAEAKQALELFEKLDAARYVDQAAAFLRALGTPVRVGPKGKETLTKREAEVLKLLGHGLSNPEISERLYISRKTVGHHVSRILFKLGVRSRAEAAAFTARQTGESSDSK